MDKEIVSAVLLTAIVVIAICGLSSLVVMWAWNTLIPSLAIAYTWKNWLAVSILSGIFSSTRFIRGKE